MAYLIIRYYREGGQKLIKKVDTLDEAQAHCQSEATHKKSENGDIIYFDGYIEA
jgi:hypothetical protein